MSVVREATGGRGADAVMEVRHMAGWSSFLCDAYVRASCRHQPVPSRGLIVADGDVLPGGGGTVGAPPGL